MLIVLGTKQKPSAVTVESDSSEEIQALSNEVTSIEFSGSITMLLYHSRSNLKFWYNHSDHWAEDICWSFRERKRLLFCKVKGYWDTLPGSWIGTYSGKLLQRCSFFHGYSYFNNPLSCYDSKALVLNILISICIEIGSSEVYEQMLMDFTSILFLMEFCCTDGCGS